MAWPASRDPDFTVLFNLAEAWLAAYKQELALDQRAGPDGVPAYDDPVKIRWGVWLPVDGRNRYFIAVLSFDTLSVDDGFIRRWERAYMGVMMDPEPCFVWATEQTATSQDSAELGTMKVRMRLSSEGLEINVPVKGAAFPSLPSAEVRRFYTDRGRYCYNFQDDPGAGPLSRGTVYDTWKPGTTEREPDEKKWIAVGTITPTPLPVSAAALPAKTDVPVAKEKAHG